MSVIDSYLDTLFAPYGDSPAMRDARTELRAMMEDKQDALIADGLSEPQAVGQVIAEFGTLEEVAPVLGIEQELSAGEGSGIRDPAGHREPDGQPRLEVEQAHRYAAAVAATQYLAAIAVPLFVLSPVPLFVLLYVRSVVGDTWWGLPLGLSMILVVVAVGVLLLHVRDTRLRAVAEEIVDGEFVPSRGSREFARRLRAENRTRASRFLGVAVVLWILSAVPLLSTSMIDQAGESAVFLGLVGTLVMVATGLFLWIRGAWADWAAEALLQEEAAEGDLESSPSTAMRVISAAYWPFVTAVFLGWGLGFDGWDSAWVIWPVAGVLYGGLWAVNSALAGAPPTGRSDR